MKHISLTTDVTAATAKTVLVPVIDTARIVRVSVVPSAAPGATKSVVIKPFGGNTQFSGDMSANAGTTVTLTPTTVSDDLNQVVSSTSCISITITATNACSIGIELMLDDHLINCNF